MYNVKNINETNVFVVKKDNAVKRIAYVGREEKVSKHLPEGTLVHIDYSYEDITDAMLERSKEKGARKVYRGVVFPSEDWYLDRADAMPCQLRRATKEEVAQCIKYAEEFNQALEEHYRKQQEEYEKECAKHKEEQERKERALEEFRGSLKGKWTKFVAKVMRKLAVELLFLAGKCNKKQMANNKLLGDYTRRYHLPEDIFKKKYGMTIDEYDKKRKEFISSGHSSREWEKQERKLFGGYYCGMSILLDVLGVHER